MVYPYCLQIPADTNVNSLVHVKSIYTAEDGMKGRNKNWDGKDAEDMYVKVR